MTRSSTKPPGEDGQALLILLLGMAAVLLIALSALSLGVVRRNLAEEYLARTQATDAARAAVIYGEELLREKGKAAPPTFSFLLPPATVNGTLRPSAASDRWLIQGTAVVGTQRVTLSTEVLRKAK